MTKMSVWLAAFLIIAACGVAARTALAVRVERFAPLYAESGIMGRRSRCSRTAAAVAVAAAGSAQDRLVAAAKTQSALYPSVLPN